ncbi:hypothetical protein Syun_003499 [Stephania yunnanensis]|uniref:Uncharacterized protein n=1 Tax=Stephania yunnanensis TaxID=152371 RepID=A0AAP0L182_9MAGN
MMEHLLSSGEVQVNPAMDFSYPHNYGRYEDSHYYNVNVVAIYRHNLTSLDSCHTHRFLNMMEINSVIKASPWKIWTCKLHSIDIVPFFKKIIDEAELCSTQPTFNPEEDVSVDTLTNLEVKDDTQMEDYLIDTSEECEVFQIEPEIVIAFNEGEDEMKIDVNSNKSEMPQIESEEDQPLVLVQPPTLPCTFGKPYKGMEVREHLQVFYNADTFVLDEPDTIYSFVLEVPNELLNLKDSMHVSLPKYVDAPFVVDISKGDGIM